MAGQALWLDDPCTGRGGSKRRGEISRELTKPDTRLVPPPNLVGQTATFKWGSQATRVETATSLIRITLS